MSRIPKIFSGQSFLPDEAEALADAVGKGCREPAFVCIFASHLRDRVRLAEAIARRFPDCVVIGCTSGGEFHFGEYRDGTVTVLGFDRSECVAVAERLDGMAGLTLSASHDLGQRALASLAAQGVAPTSGNCFALTLLDARFGNEDTLISGLRSSLGDISLFGGAGNDGMANTSAAIFHQGAFREDCAVIALIHLNRQFRVFSTHHYQPMSDEVVVTRTDNSHRVIEELNGVSAGLEYARILGVSLQTLQSGNIFLPPLMIEVGDAFFPRGIAQIDEAGGLHLACPVSLGARLRLGQGAAFAESLEMLETDIRNQLGEPELILGFECLMRRVEAESTGQAASLGRWFRRCRVMGFCSYGEQYRSMHVTNTFTGVAIGQKLGARRRKPAVAMRTEAEPAQPRPDEDGPKAGINVQRQHVDRGAGSNSDTFALFHNAVLLEEMVRRRTEELAEANVQLRTELARRRRTEESLRHARHEAVAASKSKTQFFAGVSHDMQQPLNAARLLLGRLELEYLSSRGALAVQQLEASLKTLETMLTDFFDISKLDAGGYVVAPTHFYIGAVLQKIGREFLPQAIANRLTLKVVDSSAVVHSDLIMVQRVLRNLLSNALRYTPSGRVLVGVRRRKKSLRIYVIDTGVGMPDAAVEDVFRPYFQLNNPRAVVQRGSGFGLAVVDRICSLLDADIQVRSIIGKGSSFSISLPLGRAEDIPSAASAVSSVPLPLSGARVLIIEDDRAGQDGLLALLEAWGCRTLVAGNAQDAEILLKRHAGAVDLTVADFHLGLSQPDGLTLALELAARWSIETPPVIISSDPDPGLIKHVAGAGALFVPKPIKPARLRATLSSALLARAEKQGA